MDALQFLPVLIVGFAASLGLTPLSRLIAMRLGVVDKPNARKIHKDHKPLMGGLAIYVAFALALLLFTSERHMRELLVILGGAALLAIVGGLDDRFMLGIRIRLAAQAAAALILIAGGIQIRLFDNPLLDIPLTIGWVLTITNALNFMDNMDGLSAGVTGIAAAFLMLIAFHERLTFVSALAAALAGSAIGFLIYNFNPASTFMGDMGALVLGFVLSALAIKLEFGAQPLGVTWMVPLLVLALPIFDIYLVVTTRIREGRSPGEGGKDHTSHRLMSLGLTQRQTLLVLYSACAIYGLLAFVVSAVPPEQALPIGLGGLAGLGVSFVLMMRVRRRFQVPPSKAW